MAWSKSQLESLANTIKNETGEGQNTAERVGQMFYQLIQFADSKGSSSGGGGAFDPSGLQSAIDQLRSDLDSIFNREKDKVTEIVNEVLDGKNFVNGWQAGWNEDLKAYLISVGVLGANGQDKGWAYLEVKYNEIEAAVNAAKLIIDEGGNPVSWEVLSSHFEQYIENSQAIASLRNLYALTDSEKNILRWLDAGVEVEASPNSGLAQLFAAAEDTTKNTRAISTLTAEVSDKASKQEIGGLVSQALKTSEVISEAGLLLTEDLGSAIANLFTTHENISYTQGGQTKTVSTAGLRLVTTDSDANIWIGASATDSLYPNSVDSAKIELMAGGGIKLQTSYPRSIGTVTLGSASFEVYFPLFGNHRLSYNGSELAAPSYSMRDDDTMFWTMEIENNDSDQNLVLWKIPGGLVIDTYELFGGKDVIVHANLIGLCAYERGSDTTGLGIWIVPDEGIRLDGNVAITGSLTLENGGNLNFQDLDLDSISVKTDDDCGFEVNTEGEIFIRETDIYVLKDSHWYTSQEASFTVEGTTYTFKSGILVGVN